MTESPSPACFHPLRQPCAAAPSRFTWPFCYEPHPLCRQAAAVVRAYLSERDDWRNEVENGKMFGVLVCRQPDGAIGFLAAYSGQIGGRMDWPWFVEPVFDYLAPDGYFRQEEQRITALNQRVSALLADASYRAALAEHQRLQTEANAAIDAWRQLMAASREHRHGDADERSDDERRRESQYQKAELRRLKHRWQQALAPTAERLRQMEAEVSALKRERRERSDALQGWLFERFVMLNARGETCSLPALFADTPQRTPPAGAGECCAPRLLQQAYRSGLQPLCMAEFWVGRSPSGEVRHDGQYYPACRGKCKPILTFMLQGLKVDDDPQRVASASTVPLREVYRDDSIVVVDKPAGLLSVPGLTGQPSVESIVRSRYPEAEGPLIVHRLDQATSGLLVVALTAAAYHDLQQQFASRSVSKTYVALLDGCPPQTRGTVSLPLRPDVLDRPRQVVDPVRGKQAVTTYTVVGRDARGCRVELHPHTGRTHQLRVHCAHADGLAAPIVGDTLYGRPPAAHAPRLMLHAATLCFRHPATGVPLHFESAVPF